MRVFVKESAQGVSITSPQMVIQSVMALSQADQELIVLRPSQWLVIHFLGDRAVNITRKIEKGEEVVA